MTDEHTAGPGWVPPACTLPTADRPLRLAEFDDLLAGAVIRVERLAPSQLRLTLVGDAGLETTVRDLTAREAQCCSLFAFGVAVPRPGQVRLDIEVPAAHAGVLDALEAVATVAS